MSSDTSSEDEIDERSEPGGLLPGFLARSFLAKFAISLLLVSLLIGGVSAFTYVQTTDELTEDTQTEFIGLAQQSVQQIEDWEDARSDTVRMLSQFEVVRNGNRSEINQFLTNEENNLPQDVDRVHFVNLENETILASTNPVQRSYTGVRENETVALNTRAAPWLNDNLTYGADEVFVSNASEVHLNSVVSFVSPINRGSENESFILVMQSNFDQVARELPRPNDRVFSQVVDSQGRVVAGTQETDEINRNDGQLSQYLENSSDTPDVIQRGLSEAESLQSGFIQDASKEAELSEDFVVAYARVPEIDWVVATHVPTSYAFSLRQTITQSLLALVGATLVGLLFIAVVFGRGTVRSLSRLTEKAQELEAGNLGVDLPVKRRDEFGTLTAAFASMRDSLSERVEEAEKARKEAEVARSEAVEMNSYLQEKADEYANILQKAAAGDLTARLEQDGESEAMDQIASEFNSVIEELERTTGQLKSFSEEVESAGQDVQRSADLVRTTSEDVVEDAMAVTSETEGQRDRLQRIAQTIDEITSDLQEFAETRDDVEVNETIEQIDEVAALLEEAVSRSETVLSEAEDAAATAEEQAAELSEVSTRAGDLVRYAGPLQEVLDRFQTESEHEFYFPTGPGSEPAVESED